MEGSGGGKDHVGGHLGRIHEVVLVVVLVLFFILMVVVANAVSLEIFKNHGLKRSDRFDRRVAWVLMISFALINAWFIWRASRG